MVNNKRIEKQKKMVEAINSGKSELADILQKTLKLLIQDIQNKDITPQEIAAEVREINAMFNNKSFILEKIAERVKEILERR